MWVVFAELACDMLLIATAWVWLLWMAWKERKIYMAVPSQALKRFEDHKDNPMVQALTHFITTKLERTLEQVASWGIEVSDKPSRTFYLLFTDGERFEGRLEEVWQVRVFVRESEKVLPVSPFTGEPYDPAWGYKQRTW